jgi:PKD repeat protein
MTATADADAPVSTTVKLVGDLSLEPPTRGASILPGEQVVYTHTLKNLGNEVATFDLVRSNQPSGWTYTLQPSSVALAPNQSAVVTLTVEAGASTIGQSVAVITATWRGVPTAYATAEDTTNIGCVPPSAVSIDYSPTAPVIGQTVTFTATVTGGTPSFSYTWDFGDSSGDNGRVVTHAYTDDRSYNVQLTVTNCGGAFQRQALRTVIVNPYNIYLPLVLRNYQ